MQKMVKFEGFRPFLISMKFKAVYYLQNGTMEFLYLDVSRPSWQSSIFRFHIDAQLARPLSLPFYLCELRAHSLLPLIQTGHSP